ncbi:MAG: hypothetical protein AJITA_00596 [Acetilactobacillus jinshanensis]
MITFNKLIQKLDAKGKDFVGKYNAKNHHTYFYNRHHPSEWAIVSENQTGMYSTRFMDDREKNLINIYAGTPFVWRDLEHAKAFKKE